MKELSEKVLKWYSKRELAQLKKRIKTYIIPCNNCDVRWFSLDSEGMEQFLMCNYQDTNGNVLYWLDQGEETPFGMTFLTFPPFNEHMKFFIGTMKTTFNKEMIVGCISYLDDFEVNKGYPSVTSIETVEINYFYQGQGLLQIMFNAFSKIIPKKQDIVITSESQMGKKCHVIDHLKEALLKNNVDVNLYFEYEIDDDCFKKLVKSI